MGQYRKKPVVITAEQYTGAPIEGVYVKLIYSPGGNTYSDAFIDTLEGTMRVEPGSYVITGVKGEKYPCRQDIFEETYEAVN